MDPTFSTRRWKLACGVLTALTLYSWVRSPVPTSTAAPAAARSTIRGPLRANAAALGVNTAALVERMLETQDVAELRDLATRLAIVGDDSIIEPLRPLLEDTRDGVAVLVVELYGDVGGDRAIAVLSELAESNRFSLAGAATVALGATKSPEAEALLITLLGRGNDGALTALATIGTDTAVGEVARVAETSTEDRQRTAFDALASVSTPFARAALLALVDSPSVATALLAIENLEEISEDTIATLADLARTDAELGRASVIALGRGGEAAVPILVELATTAGLTVRGAAIQALGSTRGDLALATLTELANSGSQDIAEVALTALARFDTAESRDVIVSIAMADGPLAASAVTELTNLAGDEVQQALLTIAKGESSSSSIALRHLLRADNAEAIELVFARASGGEDDARFTAMSLLAEVNTPTARAKLIDIVRASHGSFKVRAIGLLDRDRAGDPQVAELLQESLRAGNPDEAIAAASALAHAGSEEARTALVAALGSGNAEVVGAVVRSLDKYRLDETSTAALARAARSNPDLESDIMRKLVSVGSRDGTRLALDMIHGGDSDKAYRALSTLAEIGGPAAYDIAVDAVHTTEGEVRTQAIRVLGSTRDPRAVDVLTSALDDPNSGTREYVAYSLRQIGGEKAAAALVTMTRSANAEDRTAAIQNLGDSTDPAAQRRIAELTRDPNERVSQYAIYASIRTPAGIASLRSLVLDGGARYELRYAAANALQRYGELDERTTAWLNAADSDGD